MNDIRGITNASSHLDHLLASDWHHLCELWDAMRISRQVPTTEWMNTMKGQWSEDFTVRIKAVASQTRMSHSELVDHLDKQVAAYRLDPEGHEHSYFPLPKALYDAAWRKDIPSQDSDRGLGL